MFPFNLSNMFLNFCQCLEFLLYDNSFCCYRGSNMQCVRWNFVELCVRNILVMQKTECFECGKSGHIAKNCPNRQYKPRRSTGLCLLCGRLGHDPSTCSREYDPEDFKVILFAAHFFQFCLGAQICLLDSFSGWKHI